MFDPNDLDPAVAAYHEAGHVFVAMWLGGHVTEVSIECDEDDDRAGLTVVQWRGIDDEERRRRSALVALAGPIAERHWRGEVPVLESLSAWRHDWLEVEQSLQHQRDADEALRSWLREASAIVTDEPGWAHLCCIADAIEAHGTLDESLLDELRW